MRTCNRCGNIVDGTEEFCSRCGGVKFTETPNQMQNNGMLNNSTMQQMPQQNQMGMQMMNQQNQMGMRNQQMGQQMGMNNQMSNQMNNQMMGQQNQMRNQQMGMQNQMMNQQTQMMNQQNQMGMNEYGGYNQQFNNDYNNQYDNSYGAPKKSFKEKLFQVGNDGSSTKDWLFTQLFMLIPIYNIIFIIKILTGADVPDYKKTYMKSFLIYGCAAMAVSLIFVLISSLFTLALFS